MIKMNMTIIDRLMGGSARWRLANCKKPKGQLDCVKYYLQEDSKSTVPINYSDSLDTSRRPYACSISMPARKHTEDIILPSNDMASAQTRSLEVWWDAKSQSMKTMIFSPMDLADYIQLFWNKYPNTRFTPMNSTTPSWFDPTERYRIFDVSTMHGHYAAILGMDEAQCLVSRIAGTLQVYQNAWVQFVFRHYPFKSFLNRHIDCLKTSAQEIRNYGDHVKSWHPESGCDFDNHYASLLYHAQLKSMSPQVIMSIRGLVKPAVLSDPGFDHVVSMPTGDMAPAYEHLTTYVYSNNLWSAAMPKYVRITDSQIKYPWFDVFRRRLIPDPLRFQEPVINGYHSKNCFGRYGIRNPFPFLILTPDEVPRFVCPPDPSTPNIDIALDDGNMEGVHPPDPYILRMCGVRGGDEYDNMGANTRSNPGTTTNHGEEFTD